MLGKRLIYRLRKGEPMSDIVIYSKKSCPFCDLAKRLLDEKKRSYSERYVDDDPIVLEEMLARSHGLRTVPQIFINNKHIGGYDDLVAMNQRGDLD